MSGEDYDGLYRDLKNFFTLDGASQRTAEILALLAVYHCKTMKYRPAKLSFDFHKDLSLLINKYEMKGVTTWDLLYPLYRELESIIISDDTEHKNDVSTKLKMLVVDGRLQVRLLPK